jgi:YHS domain-containing protein
MTNYNLFIPAGTKVLSRKGMVELIANVYVGGAIREEDGAYRYSIDGVEYICSAGCCEAWEASPEMATAMRHKDGLLWLS